MQYRKIELAVGLFVLIGLLCAAYLTVKLGRLEVLGGDAYLVKARFLDVTGLKTGANVELGGVRVGRVDAVSLSPDNYAIVTMSIDKATRLTDDAVVSVKTSGLIGDKYIKLSLGGSPDLIEPGGKITETQSALDIEDLIGKYAFGGVK